MNSTAADEQRFLEVVGENRERILRVCRVYAWNPADRDDLWQEILLQIWRSLPALRQKQFIATWLYRVALNTAISFVRKRASHSTRIVSIEDADLKRAIETRQGEEESNTEAVANLYAAIYMLDPLEKALITLFLEGFSYEQIAEATGISANNAGVMLHRAKKKLFTLITKADQ